MRARLGRLVVVGVLATLSFRAPPAAADEFIWNDSTGTWSDAGNWGGSTPGGDDPADLLHFGGSGAVAYTATNDLADPFLLNQLLLDSTASVTSAIAGSRLRFLGDGAAITQSNSGAFTISAPMHIAADTAFDGDGSGLITLTGQLSGGGGITKSSGGTLDLFNASAATASTFFGGFTVNNGTLSVRPVGSPRIANYTLRANAITLGGGGTLLYNGSGTTLADLRIGEIAGSGTVDMTVGNGLVLTVLADATSSATVSAGGDGVGSSVAVYVRGVGTQTFAGNTTGMVEPINVYRGAGLSFAGAGATSGVLGNTSDVDLNLLGGTITFDNSAGNTTATWGRVSNNTVTNMGGGTLAYVGNAAGSAETLAALNLNAGSHTIRVTNTAGGTGAQLHFNDGGALRDSTSMVINFAGEGTGTLGSAGDAPRITFNTALNVNTTNGMLANTNGSTAGTIGWATVNGSSWAGVGANGIVALADTHRTGATLASATAWELTNLTESATLGANLTVGALKLTPSAAGQSLALGTRSVATTAVMLAGATDYTVSGTGTLLNGNATRYVHVVDGDAALTTSAVIASGSNPTNKAGAGFLVLNGAGSQNTLSTTSRLNLLAGTLRAGHTQLGFGSSGGAGILALRGGVLEISGGGDGTGTAADFRRAIGAAAGNVNWGSGTDTGDGGFSAYGSNASVNLGGAASPGTLTWGTFIQDDYVLLFGSTKSDARIRLLNPLALDGGSAGSYQARNIHVIDNPNATADYARLEAAVSSSLTSDLLKTGAGTLELAGTNSNLNGGVIIAEGTLLLGSNAALGNSAYVLLGSRGGSADTSLLTNGALTTSRDITVIAGSSGVASIGGNTDHASTFSGDIVLRKDVRLVSATTGAVTFSGAISGDAGVTIDGGGTVVLAGGSYSGATAVLQGTLQVNGSLAASSGLTLAAGARLTGTGTVSGISGGGTIAPGAGGAGILTADSVNALAGTGFDFEFFQLASPTWATPAASGNDVLAITAGSVPTLLAANVINVYFNAGDGDDARVFRGGFFTADPGEFLASLDAATIHYFDHNVPLDASRVTLATVEENGGRVLQFSIQAAPEPATAPLTAAAAMVLLRRRRRRGHRLAK